MTIKNMITPIMTSIIIGKRNLSSMIISPESASAETNPQQHSLAAKDPYRDYNPSHRNLAKKLDSEFT